MSDYVKVRNKKEYDIIMPDGKHMRFWFCGEQFEKMLRAYNIPYRIIGKEKNILYKITEKIWRKKNKSK